MEDNMKLLKQSLMASALLLASLGLAFSEQITYQGNLVNESGLAYNNTYYLDLVGSQIDNLSLQISYSSITAPAINVTDGRKSTGSITVTSYAGLQGAQGSNTITVAAIDYLTPVAATNYVTIGSVTGLAGATLSLNGGQRIAQEGVDWFRTTTTTGAAKSLSEFITAQWPELKASYAVVSGSTVVFTTSTVAGTLYNGYSLNSSTPTVLTVAHFNFSGGYDGVKTGDYVSVLGKRFVNGIDWNVKTTANLTAADINAAIVSATNTTSLPINATVSANVVTLTCKSSGTFCNDYTLTSSTNVLAVGGAKFSGGKQDETITIAGVTLKNAVDFNALTSAAVTAKAISDAIMANATLSAIINSTWSAAGVVTATATVSGNNGNGFSMFSSTVALTFSHRQFDGGLETAFSSMTNTITSSHTFTTGMRVLFATNTYIPPSPLVGEVTYYAIYTDATHFKLALTSTGAVAGTAISLSTSAGGGVFTLTPMPIAGTPTITATGSNDGVKYVSLYISSMTSLGSFTSANASECLISFASPYTADSKMWNIGDVFFRYLRIVISPPTAGGIVVKVSGLGKAKL
jgi:hypothetical protein